MQDAQSRQGSRLLGTSAPMERLRAEIEMLARSQLTVLIQGETGTGKELIARAIHAASDRTREAMVYVSCAAMPEGLAESELFGHVRGAFTGASEDRPGKFEVADGGTLLLDEIGEMPLSVQPKLLRAPQEGEIQRVGHERPLSVDVRVLAATNRELRAEVAARLAAEPLEPVSGRRSRREAADGHGTSLGGRPVVARVPASVGTNRRLRCPRRRGPWKHVVGRVGATGESRARPHMVP